MACSLFHPSDDVLPQPNIKVRMTFPLMWFGSQLYPQRLFACAGKSSIGRWQQSTTSNGKASLSQTGVFSVNPAPNQLIIFSSVVFSPRRSGLF
ncbi:hypothetical protein LINPERHAP1_LOCUS27809 [Linum perenne]